MRLVFLFVIYSLISLTLGEFGQFPFGNTKFSISITDLMLFVTLNVFFIWQLGIKKEIFFNKYIVGLGLFWLICFISLVFSENYRGIFYLIRFILYSSTFFVGIMLYSEYKKAERALIGSIIFLSVSIALVGFLQLLIYPDLQILTDYGYDPHKNRLVSVFLDPNFTGVLLNIGIGLSYYLWSSFRKGKYLLVVGLLFVALFLTYSRSAYLMFFIQSFVYFFYKDRRFIIGLFLILTLPYFFVPRYQERINGLIYLDVSAGERIYSWERGIRVFKQSPVLGVGFNNIREAYNELNLNKVFSADGGNSGSGVDSSFIFVLATTGILGMGVYIIWWLMIVSYLFKNRGENLNMVLFALVVGLFFNSQLINSLFFSPVVFIYSLLIGFVIGRERVWIKKI